MGGRNVRDGISATGGDLLAGLALPDADSLPLDGRLAAECAGVAVFYQSSILFPHSFLGEFYRACWEIYRGASSAIYSFAFALCA